MFEVKPLKAEDILYVVETGVKELGLKAHTNSDIAKLAEEREESGMCVTGFVDGIIIGCGGIDMLWEGVGEAWLLLTPYINQKPKEGYRCILKGFKQLIENNNLRRIQGYGRIGFHEAHNLFSHLKFKPEGIARKYTPDGVDCILYALIKD